MSAHELLTPDAQGPVPSGLSRATNRLDRGRPAAQTVTTFDSYLAQLNRAPPAFVPIGDARLPLDTAVRVGATRSPCKSDAVYQNVVTRLADGTDALQGARNAMYSLLAKSTVWRGRLALAGDASSSPYAGTREKDVELFWTGCILRPAASFFEGAFGGNIIVSAPAPATKAGLADLAIGPLDNSFFSLLFELKEGRVAGDLIAHLSAAAQSEMSFRPVSAIMTRSQIEAAVRAGFDRDAEASSAAVSPTSSDTRLSSGRVSTKGPQAVQAAANDLIARRILRVDELVKKKVTKLLSKKGEDVHIETWRPWGLHEEGSEPDPSTFLGDPGRLALNKVVQQLNVELGARQAAITSFYEDNDRSRLPRPPHQMIMLGTEKDAVLTIQMGQTLVVGPRLSGATEIRIWVVLALFLQLKDRIPEARRIYEELRQALRTRDEGFLEGVNNGLAGLQLADGVGGQSSNSSSATGQPSATEDVAPRHSAPLPYHPLALDLKPSSELYNTASASTDERGAAFDADEPTAGSDDDSETVLLFDLATHPMQGFNSGDTSFEHPKTVESDEQPGLTNTTSGLAPLEVESAQSRMQRAIYVTFCFYDGRWSELVGERSVFSLPPTVAPTSSKLFMRKKLGIGRTGVVWVDVEKKFSIKLVVSNGFFDITWPTREGEAIAEAKTLRRLKGTCLGPEFYGSFETEDDGRVLVMEFIPGMTVKSWTPLLIRFSSVVNAVAKLHKKNVVHGDLVPSNIRLQRNGGVRLVDFGSSKLRAEPAELEDELHDLIRNIVCGFAKERSARVKASRVVKA
ncbi:hypothetical protein JCM10207_008250 [Rhodosporidiobolus poonsookiae]